MTGRPRNVRRIVRPDVRAPHAPARMGAPAPRTSARTNPETPTPAPSAPAGPVVRPLLYTIPEAAALLRISRTKFYELLDAGLIESVHIGRSRKIPADALHDYVTRLRIPHPRKDSP